MNAGTSATTAQPVVAFTAMSRPPSVLLTGTLSVYEPGDMRSGSWRAPLAHRCVECFLPLFRSLRRWKNGCKVQVELPLFPGYVFVNILRSERVRVLDVPGILSFVGPRGEPARLSDFEIETLRSGLHLQKFEPYRGLAIGQKVRINARSVAGTGRRTASKRQWSAGLRNSPWTSFQQSVAVELDADASWNLSKSHMPSFFFSFRVSLYRDRHNQELPQDQD